MKTATLEECNSAYDWTDGRGPKFEREARREALENFPFSIIVEGNYDEFDVAENWLKSMFGAEGEQWLKIWYSKTDYDYGFWELFFKSEKEREVFRSEVTSFAVEAKGKKWRTDGSTKDIEFGGD